MDVDDENAELNNAIIIMTAKCPTAAFQLENATKENLYSISASSVLICNGQGRVLYHALAANDEGFRARIENILAVPDDASLVTEAEMINEVANYIEQSKLVCGWHLWADLAALSIAINRMKCVNLSTHPAVRALARAQLTVNAWLDPAINPAEFSDEAEMPMSLSNFALTMTMSDTDLRYTLSGHRRCMAIDAMVCANLLRIVLPKHQELRQHPTHALVWPMLMMGRGRLMDYHVHSLLPPSLSKGVLMEDLLKPLEDPKKQFEGAICRPSELAGIDQVLSSELLFNDAKKVIDACEIRIPVVYAIISHRFEIRARDDTEMVEYTGGLNTFSKESARKWIELVEDLRPGVYMSSTYKTFNKAAAAGMVLPRILREPCGQRALALSAAEASRGVRASQATSSSVGGTKTTSSSLSIAITTELEATPSSTSVTRNPFTAIPLTSSAPSTTMSEAARANLFKTPATTASGTAASGSTTTTATVTSASVPVTKVTQSPVTTTQSTFVIRPVNADFMAPSDDESTVDHPP